MEFPLSLIVHCSTAGNVDPAGVSGSRCTHVAFYYTIVAMKETQCHSSSSVPRGVREQSTLGATIMFLLCRVSLAGMKITLCYCY